MILDAYQEWIGHDKQAYKVLVLEPFKIRRLRHSWSCAPLSKVSEVRNYIASVGSDYEGWEDHYVVLKLKFVPHKINVQDETTVITTRFLDTNLYKVLPRSDWSIGGKCKAQVSGESILTAAFLVTKDYNIAFDLDDQIVRLQIIDYLYDLSAEDQSI